MYFIDIRFCKLAGTQSFRKAQGSAEPGGDQNKTGKNFTMHVT